MIPLPGVVELCDVLVVKVRNDLFAKRFVRDSQCAIDGQVNLVWTEAAIKDFYLNNILIHELGHLIDDRNTGYMDRERYAEWFAVHYGYLRSGGRESRGYSRPIRRRHHAN